MTLVGYLARTFFAYVGLLALLLGSLADCIQLFEKLIRMNGISSKVAATFFALNLVPAVLDSLPMACWLATCLLIRDLEQNGHIEAFLLLGIRRSQIIFYTAVFGCVCMLGAFLGRELVTGWLYERSSSFKSEHFKQVDSQQVTNRWIVLDRQRLCYLGNFDVQHGKGTQLLVISLTSAGTMYTALSAPSFSFDQQRQRLIVPDSFITTSHGVMQHVVGAENISVPGFHDFIRSHDAPMSLLGLAYAAFSGNGFVRHFVYEFFTRVFVYVSIMCYPPLTMGMFLWFWWSFWRWLVLALPFVFFTIISSGTSFLVGGGTTPWLLGMLLLALIVGWLIFFIFSMS